MCIKIKGVRILRKQKKRFCCEFFFEDVLYSLWIYIKKFE